MSAASKLEAAPVQRAALDPADILTVKQLAKRLRVPVSWVYKHTDNSHSNGNRLPVLRLDGHLRFVWPEVVAWMRSNGK
jgi:hypothetical protein